MPMQGNGEPTLREIDRWENGVGWLAYPDEEMRRASHALAVDGEVWVVDPVDAPGLDDLLAELGEVAGVVVGLDRHVRDAETIADRHDVPVHAPSWMTRIDSKVDAPLVGFEGELAHTGIRAIRIRNSRVPPWQEVAFHRPADGTLLVPEALGTADFFRARGERLGVHPALRLVPPRGTLGDLDPERILVGHGTGVFEDATAALHDALAGARRRAPALYLDTVRRFLRSG